MIDEQRVPKDTFPDGGWGDILIGGDDGWAQSGGDGP